MGKLIRAAAANAARGERGGTCRPVPADVDEAELVLALRSAGVGFQVATYVGRLSATIANDERAIAAIQKSGAENDA